MARVAIGIPVFNEEVYIRETLRSVLRQFESFSDIEICVSDNSSTDSSLDEVEKAIDDFSSTSSRVLVLKNSSNQGAHFNFWNVFDNTDSEYFLWIGAHDQISPNYIAEGVKKLDVNSNVAMCCGVHKLLDATGNTVEKEVKYEFSQRNRVERYLRSLAQLTNCYIFHSLFRRKALVGFDKTKQAPSLDHVLISRLLWSGCLVQSEEISYLRRYFPSENRLAKEEKANYVSRLNNVEFYDAYLSDLANLAFDLPKPVKNALVQRASDLLIKRFGLPFIQP